MKAKLTRGTGFGGVIDYVFSEKKDAKIVGGNMPGVDARQLRQEFGAVRAQRPDIEMPVWHCSLSLPAGERLSDERWEEVTQKYMQGMGFSEAHPYTVVRHSDTDHDHVHIIASRIAVGAELWYGQHELPKAIRLTQELEAEFGLVRTPIVGEKDNFSPLTAQENRIAERKGEYPPKYKLQDIIEDFFKQEDLSVSSFCSFLEKENVDIRANISKTGKMNGFSYKLGDVSYKSSSLGRAYTFDQLVRSGLDYVPSRDFQLLQRYAPSPDSTSENSSSPNTITAAFPADDRRKTARAQLRKILDEEVKKKPTVVDMCHRLNSAGVDATPNVARTGRLNGFSFRAPNGVTLRGSEIGRDYGWRQLAIRGVVYTPPAHAKALSDLAAAEADADAARRKAIRDADWTARLAPSHGGMGIDVPPWCDESLKAWEDSTSGNVYLFWRSSPSSRPPVAITPDAVCCSETDDDMAIRLQMDVAEDLWPDQEFSLLGPDDYLERARRVAAEPGMDIHFYGDPAPVQSPTTREKEPKSSAQETRHRM